MFKRISLLVGLLLCGVTTVAHAAPEILTIRTTEFGDSTRFTIQWSEVPGETTYDVLTYSTPRNFYIEQYRVVTGTRWTITVPRASLSDGMIIRAQVRESRPTTYAAITYRKIPRLPFEFSTEVSLVGDSLLVSATACSVSLPSIGCRLSIAGTIGGTPLTFSPISDLGPGQTLDIVRPIVCASSAPISVTVASRGFNIDGQLSGAVTATGTTTCPSAPPPPSGDFTVTIIP